MPRSSPSPARREGALAPVAVVDTKDGARNGVVANDGTVYLAHSKGAQVLVVRSPH
jgi:hypothetical protein